MRFSVGYQQDGSGNFIETLLRHKEHIAEIYFSWADMPSGRGSPDNRDLAPPLTALLRQKEDLSGLSDAGIPLILLFNANCYGAGALSRALFTVLGETVDSLSSFLDIRGITTASPVIARFIRNNYPALEVRASVNMEIGSIEALNYLGDSFSGFYIKREYNRDLKQIRHMRSFCDAHGKKLHILANGGCLAHCPARQFHDNLVAHEKDMAAMDNVMNYSGLCREYFSRSGTEISYIRDLRFIRPEDITYYEPYFDSVKLATRITGNPSLILNAYVNGHFNGNLLDLLEPDYSAMLYPRIIDNRRFPAGFGDHVLTCDKNCTHCAYCGEITRTVMCNIKEKVYGFIDKPDGQASGF
jgi:collagenase-like PrtC family protease